MGRSPSRSSDGAESAHNIRAEPRLLKAIEDKKHDDAIAIILGASTALLENVLLMSGGQVCKTTGRLQPVARSGSA